MEKSLVEVPTATFEKPEESAGERPLWGQLERRTAALHAYRSQAEIGALTVQLPSGAKRTFGEGEATVTLQMRNRRGLDALQSFDELRVAEAYLHGDIDLLGPPLSYFHYRDILSERNVLGYVWTNYLRPKILGQASGDVQFIGSHYDEPVEFFQLWLDQEIRSYSHGFYESDDEPIEAGMVRKFQYAIDATGAKPGDRVLDIGGGWGSFVQYGGTQGLNVTSITISDESENYIRNLIGERGLSHCQVFKEHLLNFKTDEPFDAIVNLGVSEHLPDYPNTVRQYARLLKPGGKLYLDAYSGEKFGMSKFVMKWVFQSNTSPLNLPEYLEALAATDLEVMLVKNDRHNYYLSCRKWAENLDRHRAEIVERWGELLYRRFHLYLWSAAYGFLDGILDAHRVVLQRPAQPCGRHMRPPKGRRRRLV